MKNLVHRVHIRHQSTFLALKPKTVVNGMYGVYGMYGVHGMYGVYGMYGVHGMYGVYGMYGVHLRVCFNLSMDTR